MIRTDRSVRHPQVLPRILLALLPLLGFASLPSATQAFSLTGRTAIQSPSAAALGSVESSAIGSLQFGNFNQQFRDTLSDTDTDAFVDAADNAVLSVTRATALIGNDPATDQAFGTGQIASQVTGTGSGFVGIARSFATGSGRFVVKAGDSLSFDFSSRLALNTLRQTPDQSAASIGRIAFGLYDVTNPTQPTRLSFFEIFGGLDAAGADSLVVRSEGSGLSFNQSAAQQGDLFSQIVGVDVVGQYNSQPFAQDTVLLLADLERNPVEPVPEPTTILGSLVLGSLVGLARKRRSQS